MKPAQFVNSLKKLNFKNVFNPYSDRCDVYDLDGAPERRSMMLLSMLEAAVNADIDAVWIGRDLGYRGGRRTGLALTDDAHLWAHANRWNVSAERATTGSLISERTATVVWSMLACVSAHVFLWNVFPFHPHEPDRPFSNRSHRRDERVIGEEVLAELIAMLRPRRLVAIGNDAARSALKIAGTSTVFQVRHPSYGGQRDFVHQVSRAYSLTTKKEQLKLL